MRSPFVQIRTKLNFCIAFRPELENVDHNFVYCIAALCVAQVAQNCYSHDAVAAAVAARHSACLISLITQTTPSASADPVAIWSRKLIESNDQ